MGEVIDDVLLEVRLAWMVGADVIALLMREILVGNAQHIHLDACGNKRDCRSHVLGDTRRRVQRDCRPDILDFALGHTVALEEIARDIRTVDLETQVGARMRLGQSHVVKHRAHVEQFWIVIQTLPFTGQRSPEEHPPAVIVEQIVLGIADELGGGPRHRAVGNTDTGNELIHQSTSSVTGP